MLQISIDTLSLIVNNSLLQLTDEDQLLSVINQLYSKDSNYSVLYESVLFSNISSNNMKKFIKNLNFEDLNKNVWREISNALEVNDDEDKKDISKIKRYSQYQSQGIKFYPDEKKPFNGIINYLIDKSENKIEKEVIITASTSSPVFSDPKKVVSYKNLLGGFRSKDEPNSWICFYFKKHQVTPTHYTIRSWSSDKNECKPKDWVIEGSIDNVSWQTIDEQKDCAYLNDKDVTHTFTIANEVSKQFKYIRMRLTGPNWRNSNIMELGSFELHGKIF